MTNAHLGTQSPAATLQGNIAVFRQGFTQPALASSTNPYSPPSVAPFDGTPVEYVHGWDTQKELHASVLAGTAPSSMLLLEHIAVFTAGKRTNTWDRPIDGSRVVDVDRGGKITWHGPGQIVGYPIVKLARPTEVVEYVTRLERAIMHVCATYGVATSTVEGRSGVWVLGTEGKQDEKIAAVGIRVKEGVTMHGFAFNINNDLEWASRITACGIADAGVTTLALQTGRPLTVADVLDEVQERICFELADLLDPTSVATPTPQR